MNQKLTPQTTSNKQPSPPSEVAETPEMAMANQKYCNEQIQRVQGECESLDGLLYSLPYRYKLMTEIARLKAASDGWKKQYELLLRSHQSSSTS